MPVNVIIQVSDTSVSMRTAHAALNQAIRTTVGRWRKEPHVRNGCVFFTTNVDPLEETIEGPLSVDQLRDEVRLEELNTDTALLLNMARLAQGEGARPEAQGR